MCDQSRSGGGPPLSPGSACPTCPHGALQHIAEYDRQRRHATLVAVTLSLTGHAIDLFDRLIGSMFRKAEGRHARAFQADGRDINKNARLCARVGATIIAARETKQDAVEAITAVLPWDRFCETVAEPEDLARSEVFGAGLSVFIAGLFGITG